MHTVFGHVIFQSIVDCVLELGVHDPDTPTWGHNRLWRNPTIHHNDSWGLTSPLAQGTQFDCWLQPEPSSGRRQHPQSSAVPHPRHPHPPQPQRQDHPQAVGRGSQTPALRHQTAPSEEKKENSRKESR